MKYRRLVISPELLFQMFAAGEHKGGYSVIQDAVPSDARIVNVRASVYLGWPAAIEILIQSKSFSEVPEGDVIPELMPVIQMLAA